MQDDVVQVADAFNGVVYGTVYFLPIRTSLTFNPGFKCSIVSK